MIDPQEKVLVSKRDLWEVLGHLWEKEKKDYENVLKHHMFIQLLLLAEASGFIQQSAEEELALILEDTTIVTRKKTAEERIDEELNN
jgi:hypothetical protein